MGKLNKAQAQKMAWAAGRFQTEMDTQFRSGLGPLGLVQYLGSTGDNQTFRIMLSLAAEPLPASRTTSPASLCLLSQQGNATD